MEITLFLIGLITGWLLKEAVQATLYRLAIKILAHEKGQEVLLKSLLKITESRK